MSLLSPILTSFNGGELSPRMHGRTDTAIYAIAAAEMLNFVPTVEGPAMKRPGFAHIRPAMEASTWLSPFIFSRTQAYVIEWGEGVLRFYTNGGRVEIVGDPQEVAVPYTAAQASSVWYQQSYDRLYLAHRAHPPAALTRVSAIIFNHASLTLRNGPFADQNVLTSVTVTAAGTFTVGGTATLTASTAIFLAGHVGTSFLVEAEDFSDIKAWEVGMNGVTAGTRCRSDGKAYVAATSGVTGTSQPTHSHGTEWDGLGGQDVNAKPAASTYGVQWTYQHDRFGIGTITAIGGAGTTATITVTRRLPASLGTVATHRWALSAFSAAAGWPGVVLLAFGRLIFFTNFEIVASVVGDYGGGSVNMAPFTDSGLLAPDMAFRKRLPISNPVLWAKADRDGILLGTADGEYVIRKVNNADIFSSDNIECVPQTGYGSQPIRPVETGSSTLFVQKSGRKIREANYDLGSDRYNAPNIAVWQRHILKSGAKQLTFQQEPEEMVWAVRNDGMLALHPHVPEQEIKGFARAGHAAGPVLSAVAIPSQDGTRDELWALVDGEAGKSVELQAQAWEEGETALEDAFFVDSGVSYDGEATASLSSGLDHLAGKAVSVLADGGVVAGLTVTADGELELPYAASKVHVGLGFTARLRPLRPEARAPDGGTLQGKRKRLVSLVLRLLETVGIKVDPDTGHADQLIDRPGSAEMDGPVPPFTGDTRKPVSGNSGLDGQYTIISDDPLPCMVVAAMPTYSLGER